MNSRKKYFKSIDIDSEWKRARNFEIDCLPDDPIIEDKILQQHLVDWPQIRLKTVGVSHRDAAVLLSLMGYDDPFFQTSPALVNNKPANHTLFRDELVNSRIYYEWVRNQIDLNFAAKRILEDLANLENKACALLDSLSDFNQYQRVIKIRRLKDNSKFGDQLKSASDDIRHISKSADWTNIYQEVMAPLEFLLDLIDETKPLFTFSRGKPYTFSKTWLILEAIRIYENWNIDRFKAGISWKSQSRETSKSNTNEATGPFVRFVEKLFDIFDGQDGSSESRTVRNTGLASEASKIMKHIKKSDDSKNSGENTQRDDNNLIHYALDPNLPADRYMEVLSILRKHR